MTQIDQVKVTFQCRKCKALWRDLATFDDFMDDYSIPQSKCPNGCYNFFGFSISGNLIIDNSAIN